MTLSEQQRLFSKLIAQFITWVYEENGGKYSLTLGEAWRPPEQAKLNAQKKIGIQNSLHTIRLAVDLNLWIDGVLQETTEAHTPLGEHWEGMHELCRWGGRFKDGNHYSLEFNKIK